MRKTDLAYLAGVMDSDGYIGVKRSDYSMRVTKDSGQPVYSERVCVKQVERAAVALAANLFGGSLYLTKPTASRGRALETWQLTDKKAATFLKAIRPFLRIKGEQADNCLALRELKDKSKKDRVRKGRGHVGSANRADRFSVAMEKAYQKAKVLNRVGVRDE